MKLIEIVDQIGNDFQGKYECEFCGDTYTEKGLYSYNDMYFHNEVIPTIKCPECGKTTRSEGKQINITKRFNNKHL
jgi:hypothetical protein